jgi:ABC-2 type transport system permease protein
MKNILVLAFNDLAIALKNKTIYLVLFIPLFVFISLKLIDGTDAGAATRPRSLGASKQPKSSLK